MLIPRFSLRWLFALTTLCAVISLVLSFAIRGERWAIGAAAALGGLVLLAALHVATFLAAWLFSQLEAAVFALGRGQGGSPFAAGTPPQSPFGGPTADAASPFTESPPPLTG